MWQPVTTVYLFIFLRIVNAANDIKETEFLKDNAIKVDSYVYWPNGTIPFYIEENHFDHDQKTEIEMTLATFAQKTCLKFLPVLTPPAPHQHVLVFMNPGGVRKCVLGTHGHPRDAPHKVTLGYNCLKSPHIEMVIMKALGFGFEHNRASRDLFIDVQLENIDMAFMNLFTKDHKLPKELQALSYDINSVLHFGERDYSKNGHRTIIIKDHRVKQNRVGLSPLDLRKIEIVYGPECRKRNRQEKIELCQTYPGIARRKRELEPELKSLRVNPDITPPPEILHPNTEGKSSNVELVLKELGIVNEVQKVVDQVHKVSSLAFKHARLKYCNNSKPDLRTSPDLEIDRNNDILGVIAVVANFAKGMVDNAVANLTTFCMESDTIEDYQRVRCNLFGSKQNNCPVNYKSTKSGPVKHSTQHRPLIRQSTKHDGVDKKYQYGVKFGYHRSRNDSDEAIGEVAINRNATTATTKVSRRKRAVNFEIFRNKRHIQPGDEKGGTMVVEHSTIVNNTKNSLTMPTRIIDGRRNFQVRRYSVMHGKEQSAARNWENSDLSVEVKSIKVSVGSDEKLKRKEGENEKNLDEKEITNVNDYIDIRYSKEDEIPDEEERPEIRQIKQHNRWVDKDKGKEQDNFNKKRPVNVYSESDGNSMEKSSENKNEIKKHRPGRVDREESLDNKREVQKYRERPEIENREDHFKENIHVKKDRDRPDRNYREDTLEKKREIKKYRERPRNENREDRFKENRHVKKIKERQDKENKEDSLEKNIKVTKNKKRPERDDMEEGFEKKREFKKFQHRPHINNKENRFEENGNVKKYREKQSDEESRDKSLEENIESEKYEAEPSIHKSRPQKPRYPSPLSSEEARSFKPRTVRLTKLNREFYDERRWPGGVVPYYIQEESGYDVEDIRRRLEEVNRILEQRTCVRLRELKESQLSRHQDYLILDTSADFITGRVGGKQNFGCLELFRGGQHRQHAAMMVMAMLGFYFELARHDRDKYVRVHLRHVRPDKLHHFEKIRDDATLSLPYDYKSATHPAWQFWRKLGRMGISSVATYKHLDPDGTVMRSLGQNEQLLSDSDIVKINSVYGTECFDRQRPGGTRDRHSTGPMF